MAGTNTRNIVFGVLIVVILFGITGVKAGSLISASRVDYMTSDPNLLLRGPVWVIDWTAGGETDTIYGLIHAEDIKDEYDKKFAKHDLEISSDPITNYVIWRLDPIPESTRTPKIRGFSYEIKSFSFGLGADDYIKQCQSNPNYIVHTSRSDMLVQSILCVFYDDRYGIGTPAYIRTPPETYFTINFNIKSGTNTTKVTIDSGGEDVKQGSNWKSDDGRIYIRWIGNLMSSRLWIDPPDDIAVYTKDGWGVRQKSVYDDYKKLYGQMYDKVLEWSYAYTLNEANNIFDSYIRQLNDDYYLLMNAVPRDAFVAQGITFVDKYNKYTGRIRADLKHQFIYPEFRLYVVADWIGVYKPVGIPEIVNAYCQNFRQPNGKICVRVHNKETRNAGSFELRAVCDSPFRYADQTYRFQLGPNEYKNFELNIEGYTDKTQEQGHCRVYLKETTSGVEVHEDVYCYVLGRQICIPNTKSCSPDYKSVQICSEDGMSLSTYKVCPEGTRCDIRNGVVDCYSEVGPPPTPPTEECIWWNPLTWGVCISQAVSGVTSAIVSLLTGILMVIVIIIVIYIVIKIIMHFVTVHEVKSAVKGAVEKVKGG